MNKENKRPRNKKGEEHGLWESYTRRRVWIRENYVNGRRCGFRERFWANGKTDYNENYIDGERKGLSERCNIDGELAVTKFYL